jgi:hypothetical protein
VWAAEGSRVHVLHTADHDSGTVPDVAMSPGGHVSTAQGGGTRGVTGFGVW